MSSANAIRIDTAGDDDDPRWTLAGNDSESTQLAYLDRCDYLRVFEERVNGGGQLDKSDTHVRADLARLLERERATAGERNPPQRGVCAVTSEAATSNSVPSAAVLPDLVTRPTAHEAPQMRRVCRPVGEPVLIGGPLPGMMRSLL